MSLARARNLRKNPTDAERTLWRRIRHRQFAGFRFRRQQAVGRYVVDFFCPEARLIVELDGSQHAWRAEEDEARTRWLESRGFRIVRFWNSDVSENIDGVLQTILSALRAD